MTCPHIRQPALPCAVPGCEASIVEDEIESPERWRRSGTLAGYWFWDPVHPPPIARVWKWDDERFDR